MSDELIANHDDRVRVLREKAAREGIYVPEDVLEYVADKYGLPQTLKGGLVQVMALAGHRGVSIDIELARKALGDTAPVEPEPDPEPELEFASEPEPEFTFDLKPEPTPAPAPEPAPQRASAPAPQSHTPVAPSEQPSQPTLDLSSGFGVPEPAPPAPSARVYFTPMRTTGKKSLVARAGRLLERAGLGDAVTDGDLVAVKLHFGEQGNTGFVQPIFLREVVARVKEAGGKPFLTDSNTLYRGQRFNAVDHITCALHNGFSYATVEAPIIIADGLDGREAVDVPISGGTHFESVRIGSAAVHADAMVVVTHVKGHEATGFGGALKNVGMGLGSRSAKQRMHSDFSPEPSAEKCTACNRCVQWCPVDAITISADRVAVVDYELCYGCGECVAACPFGAIAIQWKTTPDAIQEKIVEHVAGAVAGKDGKVVYLSFVTDISPDCDCWHFSDAAVVPDIGVLASTDPIAIDQAAYDLVTRATGLPGSRGEGMGPGTDKFREITGIDGSAALAYGEQLGLGSRTYELITVD